MGRAPCCDKATVKRGPWSPEEDVKLKAYIEKYGTGGNWIALPQKIGLKRCGKSCRLRWLNYLRPNIKHGGFTEEEDSIICNLYISIGSRWSIIAAQLPGRTDNDIKNYWNTRLKKKLLGRRKLTNFNRLNDPKDKNATEENSYSNDLSNSALERLQIHMQLQSLHNQFSFFNNPVLWSKLHPFQENMIHSIPSVSMSDGNSDPSLSQSMIPSPPPAEGIKNVEFYEPTTIPKADELENRILKNIVSSPESAAVCVDGNNCMYSKFEPRAVGTEERDYTETQVQYALQAESGDIVNNRSGGYYLRQEDQIAELDCFKEMNSARNSLIWWSDDFEIKSTSSYSWDEAPSLQPQSMFPDHQMDYNM